MDRRWMAGAVALALMVAGLSGCRQGDAAPAASSSVTASQTPTPSEDPLFTEAKKVYERYLEQVMILEKRGGATTLPKGLTELITGEYEKDTKEAYAHLAELGTSATAESRYSIVSIRQAQPTGAAVVAIHACVDARPVVLMDKNGKKSGRGTMRADDLNFAMVGDKLMISSGDSIRVEKCEA